MSTQWIKRSDRAPIKDDLPVMFGQYKNGEWVSLTNHQSLPDECGQLYTHWRSVKCDPPERELTQHEKDANNYLKWRNKTILSQGHKLITMNAWLEAIYTERREIKQLLNSFFCGETWGIETNSPALNSLRARLDELGGGK